MSVGQNKFPNVHGFDSHRQSLGSSSFATQADDRPLRLSGGWSCLPLDLMKLSHPKKTIQSAAKEHSMVGARWHAILGGFWGKKHRIGEFGALFFFAFARTNADPQTPLVYAFTLQPFGGHPLVTVRPT